MKEELDDLKAERERENARNRSAVAEAEEHRKENIRQRRLEGGSRFNIRYRDGCPRRPYARRRYGGAWRSTWISGSEGQRGRPITSQRPTGGSNVPWQLPGTPQSEPASRIRACCWRRRIRSWVRRAETAERKEGHLEGANPGVCHPQAAGSLRTSSRVC